MQGRRCVRVRAGVCVVGPAPPSASHSPRFWRKIIQDETNQTGKGKTPRKRGSLYSTTRKAQQFNWKKLTKSRRVLAAEMIQRCQSILLFLFAYEISLSQLLFLSRPQ